MEIFFYLICTVLAIAAFGFIVSEIEDETVRMTCLFLGGPLLVVGGFIALLATL